MERKEFALNEILRLKSECLECRECSLGKTDLLDGYNPHVFGYGNIGSKIVFCAEAPGFDETKHKIPLIGRSGQLYEKEILGGLGLERKRVYTTNTVLCRPPNNRKPTIEEMETCLVHFKNQIKLIAPKLVVTLGAVPMNLMLGIDSGITKLAGTIQHSDKFNVDVAIMLHPSFILRTGKYELLRQHVATLKEKLDIYLS